MANYFVVQDSANHWLVKFTRFGANSEIVETFTTKRAAVAYAQRLNATLEALRDQDQSGWRPVGVDVNWEDTDLTCAHTGDHIPSAYA